MKFPKPIPVKEIAEKIGAKILGDVDQLAYGINEIHKVEKGDINFSDLEKYFEKSLNSAASIIILNKEADCPPGKTILVCENPFEAYDSIVKTYRPFNPIKEENSNKDIHPSCIIEPGVQIGSDVSIGDGSYIHANAIIRDHVKIGKHVVIQSNAVIGGPAFYFKKEEGVYKQWTTGGQVIIEDNVLIGAGCTIANGVSGNTIIGEGSKLDSQVHIGHGVVVGKNCLFAAQVGIGGKTMIGDKVVLYGQVGVAQNLIIGESVVVLAKSGVSKNLEANKVYFGYPAAEAKQMYRELATLRRIAKEK